MSLRIPDALRGRVAYRAGYRCEYCLMYESDSLFSFHIDHIISKKHGGGNEYGNLAYACPHCNQFKGSDLVTVLGSYDDIVNLYNPRKQIWSDHFWVNAEGFLLAKSKMGEGTIKMMNMNDIDRVIQRQLLIAKGEYP